MEQDQQLDAILTQAYNQAPPYIQSYLKSGQFDTFMGMLTTNFGLHADVAGRAENEILMTIIGMTAPNELEANLRNEAGVAPGLITPILEELNKEVFVPLRESLRSTAAAAPVTPAPAPQPTPEREWVSVTPPPSAPVVPTPTVSVPPVAAPIPTPAPTPVIAPQPAAPTPVTQPVTQAPAAPVAPEYHELHSMMRTMSKDIEALKSGAQPAMQPWKPISVPTEPVATTPIAAPAIPTPTPIVEPAPQPEVKAVPNPIVHERVVVPPRSGGGDPYREPIE